MGRIAVRLFLFVHPYKIRTECFLYVSTLYDSSGCSLDFVVIFHTGVQLDWIDGSKFTSRGGSGAFETSRPSAMFLSPLRYAIRHSLHSPPRVLCFSSRTSDRQCGRWPNVGRNPSGMALGA